MKTRLAAILVPAVLLTAAFILSCQAALRGVIGTEGGGSLMGRLLGSGRVALGDQFYRVSDVYYHRGGEDTGAGLERRDWYARMGRKMAQRKHLHLEGDSRRNVLPWLQLTVKADPHAIEPYLVASFTLRGLKDLEGAERILDEGRRNNPASSEIELEAGRVYLARGEVHKAGDAFQRGLNLLDRSGATNEEARLDRKAALLYKGMIDEALGEPEAAKLTYARFLDEWPDDKAIRQHYENLLRDPGSATNTAAALFRFFKAESDSTTKAHTCAHEEHDHGHNGEDHDGHEH